MKCSNCGNLIPDGLTICPSCNNQVNTVNTSDVPETPVSPVLPQDQGMVVENIEEKNMVQNMNVVTPTMESPINEANVVNEPVKEEHPTVTVEFPSPEEQKQNFVEPMVEPTNNIDGEKIGNTAPKTKKKKKKGLIIVLLILLVLIGVGVYGYFYEFKSADKRIDAVSKKLFSFTSDITNENVLLASGTYSISGDIKTGETSHDLSLSGKYAYDIKNKVIDFGISVDGKDKEIFPSPLNLDLYLNETKAYIKLDNFYDKYVYLDVPEIDSIWQEISSNDNDIDFSAIIKSFEDAYTKALNTTSKEQSIETVKIDGKSQKVNVVRIKMTAGNQKVMTKTFINSLKNDKKFIANAVKVSKYMDEEYTEEELKEELDKILEDAVYEDEDEKIEFYFPLVGDDLLGVKVVLEEDKFVSVYLNDNGFKIVFEDDNEVVATISIDVKEKKNKETIDYEYKISLTSINDDDEKVTANLDISLSKDVNPKAEKKNIENSINIEDMTIDDFTTIINNVTNYGALGTIISEYFNTIPGLGGSELDYPIDNCSPGMNCMDIDYWN